MTQTPSGLPYPQPGDHTRLWEHFQDLAEAADDNMGAVFRSSRLSANRGVGNQTSTFIELATTIDDTSAPSHGKINKSGDEFVVPVAGLYSVAATMAWEGNASGTRIMRIRVDGAMVANARAKPSSADRLTLAVSWMGMIAGGGRLSLEAWQNSGGTVSVEASPDVTGMQILLVRPLP